MNYLRDIGAPESLVSDPLNLHALIILTLPFTGKTIEKGLAKAKRV